MIFMTNLHLLENCVEDGINIVKSGLQRWLQHYRFICTASKFSSLAAAISAVFNKFLQATEIVYIANIFILWSGIMSN